MTRSIVGIIGGSGVYDFPGLADVREERFETHWGEPSDALRFGRIGDAEVVFLARHGRGHRFSPSGVNYRANIEAMKRAGVTDIVGISACGSFKPELPPGLFVLVDQYVDHTIGRPSSFFGNGVVAHVSMARPVAPLLRKHLLAAARAERVPCVDGGTYLCIEGPQFSSLAECLTFKAAGYDVIGMTAMPEAKLAREAELSYATVAMVTDFDCWHSDHAEVDLAQVISVSKDNAAAAARLLHRFLTDLPGEREPCPVADRALEHAIFTAPEARDPALVAKLEIVAGRVLRR
jgi:5'-methylthioadenosine phosphorylase